jgi:hypothetical protein
MATARDLPKLSAQGERFIALARQVDIQKPEEAFERRFDELAVVRPTAQRTRKIGTRVTKAAARSVGA